MLKHGEPNPLNIFGLRQLNHCPPHFERVVFDAGFMSSDKGIKDWIWENLEGRFYLGVQDAYEGNKLQRQQLAAFESTSEASYFALFLPQIININTTIW